MSVSNTFGFTSAEGVGVWRGGGMERVDVVRGDVLWGVCGGVCGGCAERR